MGLDGIDRWMDEWMDATQGNPVRTPARATLAGATDDDACMVLLYNAMRLCRDE